MTKRFKQAVEGIVKDGSVKAEEKELLRKLAKEENISEIDAEIYIIKELKSQQLRIEKSKNTDPNWFERNFDSLINIVTEVAIPAVEKYFDPKMVRRTPKNKK